MGGQSGQQSQTSAVSLSPQQQSLLSMGMPFASQFASNQPALPSADKAIAGFTAPQAQGQSMALGAAAGPQSSIASNAENASNFLTSGAALAGPNKNPYLDAAIQGAVLPARQNLTMNTLPGIRQQATGVGGMGNSREGVAEGVATGLEAQGEQATGAQMENTAYQGGIQAMTQALGLAPSTQGAVLAPATTTSAVGDVQQQLAQQLASYGTEAGLFGAEQPATTAELLMGLGAGIPGGSTTTTGTGSANPSALQYGVGGASILGSLLSPGTGGTSALGGLGSILSNAGSSIGNMFGGSSIAQLLPFLAG